jgi:hypothetical protein
MGSSWNDIYLRKLKYACLHYAVCPLHQGLLQGPAGPDRARLLCVLTASGGSVAASLLNQCDGTSRLQKRGNAWTSVQTSCSLSLAEARSGFWSPETLVRICFLSKSVSEAYRFLKGVSLAWCLIVLHSAVINGRVGFIVVCLCMLHDGSRELLYSSLFHSARNSTI